MSNGKGSMNAAQRRTGIAVAGGLLLLVFGFTIALTLPTYVDRNNPFWIVGMLVIFGGALSLIAIVFSWLGMGSRDEAFGLPTGSIRTLLAIGVMVLFAVFGLAAITVDGSYLHRPSDQPLGTAVAPASSLNVEMQRYERQGIVPVVERIENDVAAMRLYRDERIKPAETTDMQKQVLTALVTLLTSVVSFYFGSRSAEATKNAKSKAPASNGDQGASDSGVKELDAAIAEANRRLAAVQRESASPGNEAALAAVLERLALGSRAVAEARASLDAALAEVAAGRAPAGSVDPQLTALRGRLQGLDEQLREAEGLVAKG